MLENSRVLRISTDSITGSDLVSTELSLFQKMIEELRIAVVKRNGKVVRLRHNSGIALLLCSDLANVATLLILVILFILANLVGCNALFLLCFAQCWSMQATCFYCCKCMFICLRVSCILSNMMILAIRKFLH